MMFRRLKLAAAIAVIGALLLGTPAMAWDWSFGAAVVGSGQVTKTQRQLTGFKGLSLELPSNVEIVQGDTEGVQIETDQNIAPLIEAVVENDQLKIRSIPRSKSLKPTSLKITVQARTIERISISGSGDVDYCGDAAVSQSVAGSGRVRKLGTTPSPGG